MRYFRIWNNGITKTRPKQELDKDVFIADVVECCINQINILDNDQDFERAFNWYFEIAQGKANSSYGLCAGDYYLYSAGDDKSILDFNRKNC